MMATEDTPTYYNFIKKICGAKYKEQRSEGKKTSATKTTNCGIGIRIILSH
jgi:hypothetical protein